MRQQAIPFELKLETPNAQTIEAMLEAQRLCNDPNAKTYSSFAEILAEIEEEIRTEEAEAAA